MKHHLPHIERFYLYVEKSDGCWLWKGGVSKDYGTFKVKRRTHRAHRWIYQHLNGPLSADIQVCHSCDNSLCVRPDHLFAGTQADNMRDCAQKKRNAMQLRPWRSRFNRPIRNVRGEQQGCSKLTAAQVIEIRAMSNGGAPASEIANLFSISAGHVRTLAKGKAWRHLTETPALAKSLPDAPLDSRPTGDSNV
jgi:DNA-binding CsgD family transcriptional regulator